MTIATTVLGTLQSLQNYYKRLYFFRIFFPAKLKRLFIELEKMNLTEVDELNIVNLVNNFYLTLSASTWYTRVFLFFFSTVSRFAQSKLIEQVAALDSKGLANATNLTIMFEYEDLEEASEGLRLLESTAVVIHNIDDKRRTVSTLLRMRRCTIDETLRKEFYKKIAQTQGNIDFSAGIKILQRNAYSFPYMKYLLGSTIPTYLAAAFYILGQYNLLPTTVEIHAPVRSQILSNSSVSLKVAIFTEILRASNPALLAQFIVDFRENLTVDMLPQLETHRLNMVTIAAQYDLDIEKQKDMTYCQDLADTIREIGPEVLPSVVELFDRYHGLFAEESIKFRNILSLLNSDRIWGSPHVALYKEFLEYGQSQGRFFVYAELLANFAQQNELLVDEEQVSRVLDVVKNCANVEEFLKRVKGYRDSNVTVDLLQATAIHLEVHRTKRPLPPQPNTGLRRRYNAPIPNGKNEDKAEEGKVLDNEDKPKDTPSKTSASYGGFWGTLAYWTRMGAGAPPNTVTVPDAHQSLDNSETIFGSDFSHFV